MVDFMEALAALPGAFAALLFVGLTCCVVAFVRKEIETQRNIARQNASKHARQTVSDAQTEPAPFPATFIVPMAGMLEGGPFPPPVVQINAPLHPSRRFPTHPIAPRLNRPTVRQQIANETPTPEIPDETQKDEDQQIAASQQTQIIRFPRRFAGSPSVRSGRLPPVISLRGERWIIGRPGTLPRDELN